MAKPSAISRNLPLSLSNPRSPPTLVASCLTSLSNFPRLPPHVASNQQSYFPKLSVPSRVHAPASKFLQMGPHKTRPLQRFQVKSMGTDSGSTPLGLQSVSSTLFSSLFQLFSFIYIFVFIFSVFFDTSILSM